MQSNTTPDIVLRRDGGDLNWKSSMASLESKLLNTPHNQQFNGDLNDPNDHGNYMDVEGNSSPANHSKKAKRAWELWSSDDKNHFFEIVLLE